MLDMMARCRLILIEWVLFSLNPWSGKTPPMASASRRLPWLEDSVDELMNAFDPFLHSNIKERSMFDDLIKLCNGDDLDSPKALTASDEELSKMGKDLVYGELTASGILSLKEAANLTSNDVFLDLGSGTGIVVLVLASLFDLEAAAGVEYASQRHEIAQRRLEQLSLDHPTLHLDDRVFFVQGSFLDEQITKYWYDQATVVFCNSIMFSEETRQSIGRLLQMMPRLRLVVSGMKLHDECKHDYFSVSWGSDSFGLWICEIY